MRFGFGRLRLSPDHFWRMTPLELDAAVRAHLPPERPTLERSALAALIDAFPDTMDERDG